MQLDSPVLRVVSTLSLTLVLFTDAVTLNIKEVQATCRSRVPHAWPRHDCLRRAHSRWWRGGFSVSHLRRPRFLAPRLLQLILCYCEDCCDDATSHPKLAMHCSSRADSTTSCCFPSSWLAIALTGHPRKRRFPKMGFGLFILGPGAGIAIGLTSRLCARSDP